VADLLAAARWCRDFKARWNTGPRPGQPDDLFPPDDPSANDWLNKQLGRSEFMPFAPAVLDRRPTAVSSDWRARASRRGT
jgi:carbamoyltransferase